MYGGERWVCPHCRANNMLDSLACFKCGTPQPIVPPAHFQQYPPPQPSGPRPDVIQMPPGQHNWKNAVWAAVVIGWWLGSINNKQGVKGVLLLLVQVALAYFILSDAVSLLDVAVLVILWITGIQDTIATGKRIHRGEPVGQWQSF